MSSDLSRRLRRARTSATRLGAMATNRQVWAAVLAEVPGLRPTTTGTEPDGTGASVEIEPPPGVADFSRQVSAVGTVPADLDTVAAYVATVAHLADWLTMHSSFGGEVPDVLVEGAEFREQILLMDIPAEARWKVARADATGFELRGTGPMGITLALWCTLAAQDPGAATTAVRLDAGLDGSPLRGPVGATAVRSVEAALRTSVAALAEHVGGAPRLRVADDDVLHHASGRLLPARTPVLVGVGQVVQREPDPTRDPVALACEALRAAALDSGSEVDLLTTADHVYAVPSASWTYRDQAALVAETLGCRPEATVQSSPYGGDGAQLVVNDAAEAIVQGRARVVLLAGAEAGATASRAHKDGVDLDWPVQAPEVAPDRVIGIDRVPGNAAETAVGLGAPIWTYALLESAVQRRLGRTTAEHRNALGELWSRFSEVASRNPFAWSPPALDAEEITTATPGNRAVSAPYTKLMCANLQVDLATGLVMTSVAAAEAAGVPQDRWVFVHAGASAHDEWFVSERADLSRSPAIAAAGAAALEHAGLGIEDVELVDLYACFPSAVEIGAEALGLPVDDPERPLTVTGGLTFAGGPGNNYGSHAIATMVPQLRAQPAAHGLTTSLGWYATKHALAIWSATPPAHDYAHLRPLVDAPRRPVLASYDGLAVLEAFTLPYDRAGHPEAAIVSLLVEDGDHPEHAGSRVLVRSTDDALVARLLDEDLLGALVRLGDGEVEVVDAAARPLPEPPRPPVRTERRGAVLVVTLDRPEVRNAIDARTAEELERAIDAAEADDRVRAIVLTGAGDTFCAGMDLKAAARGELPVTERRGPLGLTGLLPAKPMVVAVEGSALAGGLELALCGDLVVAAEDATFGLPEVRRGLLAAAGGVLRLAQRLPRSTALEMALLGEPLPATRLAELGLVNRVVPRGQALAEALVLADSIAANAPLSVAAARRVVDESPGWSPEEAFERQTEIASPVILSEDAREGVAAYAEGREPTWTGR